MRRLAAIFGLLIVVVMANVMIVRADPPPGKPTPSGKGGTPPGLDDKTKGMPHGVFGTVTAKGTSSFTISAKQGSITIIVTDKTRFHIPRKKNATFADLMNGDRVAVNGTPTAAGLNAKQIAVTPGKPTTQHRVGTVKEFVAGKQIVIQDVKGETFTFLLTAQTEIRNPKTTGVAVGDRVTVVSRRDPSTDEFTATAIVVHPNK